MTFWELPSPGPWTFQVLHCKGKKPFLSRKSFGWLWCTDRFRTREESYGPQYWSIEPLFPEEWHGIHIKINIVFLKSIKIDVTQCMDFSAQGLWELPVQTHAASSPCSYSRGNERPETPRVGINTVFISSFLFVTWCFSSKRKKKNQKQPNNKKLSCTWGFT